MSTYPEHPHFNQDPTTASINEIIKTMGGDPPRPIENQVGPAVEIPDKETARQRLQSVFGRAIGRLAFAERVIIPEGRKIPKSLGQFSLLPFIGRPQADYAGRPGDHYSLPGGIRTTYGSGKRNRPYLDAEFALGLVREDWLVALAASNIDPDGNIIVTQLQDVSGTNSKQGLRKRSQHYKTGLHDGFLWRDTLVTTWIQTAIDTGIGDKVLIQGAANNRWLDKASTAQFERAYDRVAERLGFVQNDQRNWEVDLYAHNLIWPELADPTS